MEFLKKSVEKIKKIGRVLGRDVRSEASQEGPTLTGSFAGSAAVLAGLYFTLVPVFVVFGAGVATGFTVCGIAACVRSNSKKLKESKIDGSRVIGPKKYVDRIDRVSRLIFKKTQNLVAKSELSRNEMYQLRGHIGDAQEALAHVRVYNNGEEQKTFTLFREVFNEKGNRVQAPLVELALGGVKNHFAEIDTAPKAKMIGYNN